jgi:hypothetical protein
MVLNQSDDFIMKDNGIFDFFRKGGEQEHFIYDLDFLIPSVTLTIHLRQKALFAFHDNSVVMN